MNLNFLTKCNLFENISYEDAQEMLRSLQAYTKNYQKREIVYHIGDKIQTIGIILAGSVHIERDDVWGNKTLLDRIGIGQVFAEAYACAQQEPLMVNVVAAEKSEILFLNMSRVLQVCPQTCGCHRKLIQNLLKVTACRNLSLTRKIFHTTPKTLRGKILSYLSDQALLQGKYEFKIPFNRQQMADYLGVDRSAMSNELWKMKREGLIDFEKNDFSLLKSAKRVSAGFTDLS